LIQDSLIPPMMSRTMTTTLNTTLARSAVILVAAVSALLTGCATTAPEEDPVVQKMTELDSRLLRIERVFANQSLLDLSQRIEATQAEVRSLRGQFEELQHTQTKAADQQRELYGDVDRRLALLEGGGAAANSAMAPNSALPV